MGYHVSTAGSKEKYSSQQDERELVAMKAEMWLKTQPLPPTTPMSGDETTSNMALDDMSWQHHAAKTCPNKSVIL